VKQLGHPRPAHHRVESLFTIAGIRNGAGETGNLANLLTVRMGKVRRIGMSDSDPESPVA